MDLSLVLTAGAPSARTEMIHEAHPAATVAATTLGPAGQANAGHGSALRMGKYKLLVGVSKVGWITESCHQATVRSITRWPAHPRQQHQTMRQRTAQNKL
jgi:hypothetical protein